MKLEDKNVEKILVIDLLYLGDLIFATPFLRQLRKNFADKKIDMVVNSNFFDIIEDNPYLDQVYSYDKSWNIKQSWKFALSLKKNDYDLGLNIHGNWRTVLLTKIINPKFIASYGNKGKKIFIDRIIQQPADRHMVDTYLQFLKELGLKVNQNRQLDLFVPSHKKMNIKKKLSKMTDNIESLVGIHSGGTWPTKRWDKDKFACLADILQGDYQKQVILLGGPDDIDRVREIEKIMETKPINMAGKTDLKELAALTAVCDLVISGDSGPVHVAAAVGTPTITLFGPSDERKYRPYGKNHKVVKTDLECRPCGKHQCPRGDHKCM
ncbi:MAG: glycosyltransferase family 9 protein, partial [bacterium]